MNRQLVVGVCLFLVSACGTAEVVNLEESAPPVVLHELDIAPGCYVPQNPTVGIPDQSTSMVDQMAQFAEMNLSFAVQRAALMLRPVLDNPEANEWLEEGLGDSRIEGQSLARGDGWGELILVLIGDDSLSVRTEVHYDPHATVIEMNGSSLMQTANVIRTDAITLGCDPEKRWSFRVVGGLAECWDESGEPLFAPPAPTDTETGTSGATAVAGAGSSLQCQALMQRTLQL